MKHLYIADAFTEKIFGGNPAGVVILKEGDAFPDDGQMRLTAAELRYSETAFIRPLPQAELAEALAQLGQKTGLDGAQQVLEGIRLYRERFGLRGIVLHTKAYALYYGKPLEGIDMEQGLTLGNLMAATRARTGRYGSLQDCRESLALPLSERGKTFTQDFMSLAEQDEEAVSVAVPSRYIEHPRYTIGLGDTFTAGVQISFQSRIPVA